MEAGDVRLIQAKEWNSLKLKLRCIEDYVRSEDE
jgi:hypothetical protein